MFKRLMSTLAVAGLLSGGAIMAAASPSSAMRDNPCMDQQNYNSQMQYYEENTAAVHDVLSAFENPTLYVNPWGQDVYAVSWDGNIHVYSTSDYNTLLRTWQTAYNNQLNEMDQFIATTSVCP